MLGRGYVLVNLLLTSTAPDFSLRQARMFAETKSHDAAVVAIVYGDVGLG